MKKLIILIAMLSIGIAQAQIKVKINNKPVIENETVKVDDIKTFDVAFDKPKKLSYIGTGRLIMGVAIYNADGFPLEDFTLVKNGTNAIESFLTDVNVFLNVIPDASGERAFMQTKRGYNFLDFLAKNEYETLRVEIKLLFFDKVGYEKYGEPTPLVKKFTFMLDNKTNAAKQAQMHDAANAERAAKEKADAATQAEAEAKKKKKGLIKGLLNR